MNSYELAGIKLKSLREVNNFSLKEVAEELDITPNYLTIIENGKQKPSKKVLKKAAILFNVEVDSFQESSRLLEQFKQIAKTESAADVRIALNCLLKEQMTD